jgi:hypothetical protein
MGFIIPRAHGTRYDKSLTELYHTCYRPLPWYIIITVGRVSTLRHLLCHLGPPVSTKNAITRILPSMIAVLVTDNWNGFKAPRI